MSTVNKALSASLFYDSTDAKLRKLAIGAVIGVLFFNLMMNLLPTPKVDRMKARELPPRLTKLVLERKQEVIKQEEIKQQEQKKEEKKKEEEKKTEKKDEKKPEVTKPESKPEPKSEKAQVVTDKPKRSVEEIRERAAKSGILAMKDELADLRDDSLFSGLSNDKPLAMGSAITAAGSGRAGGTGGGPSAISSAATRGSGGINTAGLSRDTGATQQLASRTTTQVSKPIKDIEAAKAKEDAKESKSGGARSREDIDVVVDANKGALMSIYQRALRENPSLQGKVVFEITIEPDGHVSSANIKSSDLNDAEVEKKLATRLKMLKFGAKDVGRTTVNIPMLFTPSMG